MSLRGDAAGDRHLFLRNTSQSPADEIGEPVEELSTENPLFTQTSMSAAAGRKTPSVTQVWRCT
jgi:hypothetical protein